MTVGRILNVDDYQPSLYARTRVLRKAGFDVLEATCGSDALQIAEREAPEVVVLDVNLPDMSGFDVSRRLKERDASVLILHVSATAGSTDDRVLGLDNGADGFLAEPLDSNELLANVRALLRLKRADEALRGSRDRVTAILESITDGYIALDDHWRVLEMNRVIEQALGVRGDTVRGRVFWDVVPDFASGEFSASLRRAVDTDAPVHFEARAADRWFEAHAYPRESTIEVYIRDISERKRNEEKLGQLYQEAQRANRTKDAFLAVLSHELRTPLNAILGWARLLRAEDVSEDVVSRGLEAIDRNASAQAKLIEDILDVSRIVSGGLTLECSHLNLRDVIREVIESLAPLAAAKGLTLTLALAPDHESLTVRGDRQRLSQMLVNLVSNSIKFTPADGRVDVSAEATGENARITVSDTGIGIAPEFLPHVFERFRQADSSASRAHGGLGLGLGIARHIAEKHGGSIEATSAGLGQGARFVVTLPKAQEGDPPYDGSHDVRSLPDLHGCRVLVVDDDADSHEVVALMLRRRGVTVETVFTATEALKRIEQSEFDAVITDVGMPGQNGYDLVAGLRARAMSVGYIPTIALTAYVTSGYEQEAYAQGFDAFLRKPVDDIALITILANVLRK